MVSVQFGSRVGIISESLKFDTQLLTREEFYFRDTIHCPVCPAAHRQGKILRGVTGAWVRNEVSYCYILKGIVSTQQ